MVFRRFVLACSMFLFLGFAVVLTTAMLMSSSTGEQPSKYAGQVVLPIQDNQQSLSCPDAPHVGQAIFFDFCSPKYVGDVAGPFGSHIVLVAENFPKIPQTWIITRNQPLKNAEDLRNCLQRRRCLPLPQPTEFNPQRQMTLFSWTWNDSFPNQVGDYFIVAVIRNFPATSVQIMSTPVAFTLLTSQAPCIVLRVRNISSTNCVAADQNFPINLSNTTTLTIQGFNWILGWRHLGQQFPITETVDIYATCSLPHTCNLNQLFHIIIPSSQIDTSGTFTTSVPLHRDAKGSYLVRATNFVVQVAILGVPDKPSRNTIADSSLTFGGSGDPIMLNLAVKPAPPIPTSLPLAEVILDLFATLAALPALFGIIMFGISWNQQRKTQKLLTAEEATSSSGPAHQPSYSQEQQLDATTNPHSLPVVTSSIAPHQEQVNSVSSWQKLFTEHEYPFVMFEDILAKLEPLSGQMHRSLSNKRIDKKIRKAVNKWIRKDKLDDIFAVASIVLVEDFTSWTKLAQQLEEKSSSLSFDNARKIEQQAIKTIHTIRVTKDDTVSLRSYCSMALVYGTILHFCPQFPLQNRTAMLFDMGFACTRLMSIAQQTTATSLSREAEKYYGEALSIYNANRASHLYTKTLIALGDVNIISSKLPGPDANKRLGVALDLYRQAQAMADLSPLLSEELKIRIQAIQQFLPGQSMR